MVILLFGPPGCGKGTQSPCITDMLGIPSISTGEMLRAEVAAGTELGKVASEIMASGGLVTDELVNKILINRISRADAKNGFQLDGYPRTVAQAEFLDAALRQRGLPEPMVLYFTAPDEVLIQRITSRRQCPTCGRIYNLLFKKPQRDGVCDVDGTALIQRKDDNEVTVRQRLAAYNELTKPVIEHYSRGDFHTIDANRTPTAIFEDVKKVLEPHLVGSVR